MKDKEISILIKDGEIAILNVSWGTVEYAVKKDDVLILKKAELDEK